MGDVFVQVLVQISEAVQELSSSQHFYGDRRVTLTFDPVTFSMSSLSRGPPIA